MCVCVCMCVCVYIYIYNIYGYLFPLCRSTAFKLSCEESIKNTTQLDRVGVQESL